MKRILFLCSFLMIAAFAHAQKESKQADVKPATLAKPMLATELTVEKINAATSIKNQDQTGTCWCFSGTSLLESQFLKRSDEPVDLSEMFTVYNMYIEKAQNYFLRQGHAQFGEGGLGHDVIRSIARYGAMPQSAFTGLLPGKASYSHQQLVTELKTYLDSAIVRSMRGEKIGDGWQLGVSKLLRTYIGTPPAEFQYEGKTYTAKTFAQDYLHFNADDYVNITSFTDHEFYKPFILSVPDNFSNGSFYNVPMTEMAAITKNAVKAGYTVLWDADVSNDGFAPDKGVALNMEQGKKIDGNVFNLSEEFARPETRQRLYESLTTQDDHLMHIIGLERSSNGRAFFVVKNSWGTQVGPYGGFVNVSEDYFNINTVSLVVPKAAISKALLDKLQLK